ncbi:hypothetical protein [Maliponia aquimaris]|uniref:Sulfotransferase family protein n=1 Tax=Maliponia aquimaris TaxID=1673631 RepID=A0A238KPS1_9RHOB|nr:hypothetical protein [Maliponia aquimaris]SMX44849.1 hypothetical protein MAA8898_03075 [Maliponia aquimaris]
MIDPDFVETGLQIALRHAPPTRFQVFGERSSGTNFVKRLVGRNTAMTPIEDLGWKHGFVQMTAIPGDVAILCTVRDARAWALSMHAKPWHCPPDMQALALPDFLRAEWATVADHKRYFPQVGALGGTGMPLQQDRHPLTGMPFANLFALRRAKLEALLSFMNRGCTVALIRMETVQAAPEAFVDALRRGLGLPPPDTPFRPVIKRLGSKFRPAVTPRPDTPAALAPDDLALLRRQVDLGTETALGYDYA